MKFNAMQCNVIVHNYPLMSDGKGTVTKLFSKKT